MTAMMTCLISCRPLGDGGQRGVIFLGQSENYWAGSMGPWVDGFFVYVRGFCSLLMYHELTF